MNMRKKNKNKYIINLIMYKPILYSVNIFMELLMATIPLAEGIVVKEFFDIMGGKVNSNFNQYQLVFFMVLITIIHVIIKKIYFINSNLNQFYITTLLRRNMLNLILKKPGSKAIKTSVGEVLNCFRDDVSQIETTVSWLGTVIGQVVRAIGAIIILSYINVKITFAVFIPLILVIRIAQKSEKNIEINREKGRMATGEVNGFICEIFDSILTIKVAGAKQDIIRRLRVLNDKRHKIMIKDTILTQLIDSIYNNAINLGTGAILLLCASSIGEGTFTVGDFSIFVYYLAFVTDSIESLGNFIVYLKQTNVGYRNILKQIDINENSNELLKYKNINLKEEILKERNIEVNNESIMDLLIVEKLTYIYDKSQNGIKDISFSLKKGEILVVAGRTGSGKSTLLKSLLGLLPKSKGEVYYNNKCIEDNKSFFIPPISAYMPQIPSLFSDTVKSNIFLGVSENSKDLDKAIWEAVFEKDIEILENKLETVIGTKGTKLSGGQIQRLAAARMFVRKSQIFILDDISSALDISTEKTFWTRLLKNNESSFIIVSNKRFILEKANKIIVLKDGRIESEGTFNELIEKSMEFKNIV
ncbi:ATP-binding cassette domain-containing protein [Clostridium ihumii]|uniref:ATP-binding cassette domain-containing protein n=1 Tax=Clostridium ihumii TaxID=1470356 RepID=UPI0006872B4E|nr:ABC transporter ATP-binding protein [Clostridium ihumii]